MSVEEELEQNIRIKSNKLVSYDIYLKLVMESDMVPLKSMKSGYGLSELSAPEKNDKYVVFKKKPPKKKPKTQTWVFL